MSDSEKRTGRSDNGYDESEYESDRDIDGDDHGHDAETLMLVFFSIVQLSNFISVGMRLQHGQNTASVILPELE